MKTKAIKQLSHPLGWINLAGVPINKVWWLITTLVILFSINLVFLGLHLLEASYSTFFKNNIWKSQYRFFFWEASLRYHVNLIQCQHPAHLRTIYNLFWSWSSCVVFSWICSLLAWEQSGRELSGHWKISIISYLLWPSAFCILIRKKWPADCHLNCIKMYLSFGTCRHLNVM